MAVIFATARRLLPALAAPLAALLCAGCFATRNDVRVLQSDIQTLRAERAYGDSARGAQIDRIIAQLSVSSDTLRSLATQSNRFQGDAREALRELRDAVTQVQEVTTQLQRRLQDVRAAVEARGDNGTAAPGDSTAAGPGPNQLYQLGRQQFDRQSYPAARTAFDDLLKRYPTSDVAPDALYYTAEAFAAEKNIQGADSTYGAVTTRYPQSPRAATALYKRARLRQTAGRTADAKQLFKELLDHYPKSDEAALACGAMPSVCPKR
jgi:tol-pal system protein YbgF